MISRKIKLKFFSLTMKWLILSCFQYNRNSPNFSWTFFWARLNNLFLKCFEQRQNRIKLEAFPNITKVLQTRVILYQLLGFPPYTVCRRWTTALGPLVTVNIVTIKATVNVTLCSVLWYFKASTQGLKIRIMNNCEETH